MKSSLHRPGGVLLAGALVASVFACMPAAHAVGGGIGGTVNGPNGSMQPLDGIDVTVYEQVAAEWDWVGATSTDFQGHYSIPLPSGTYLVEFNDSATGDYLGEYYNNAATMEQAEPIPIVDVFRQIDVGLAVAGHITGTVTGPGTPAPALEGIDVAALEKVANGPDDFYWSAVKYASTDVSGNYDLGALPTGTYRVEFGDRLNPNPYASEFYNDQASATTAQDIAVVAGEIDGGIDAVLAPESTISGTVTDAADQPIDGTLVLVYERANGAWERIDQVRTNGSGGYTLSHLPRGTYRVEFEFETPDGDYLSEAYNNKRYLTGADDIVVAEDQDVLKIDAKLIAGEHAPVPFTMTAMPVISGTPQVGSTLTVTGGSWTPAPDETYFYWFRGEEFIEGAYGTSYVPTAADVGKTLSVLVQVYGEERYDFANTGNYGPITAVPVPVVAAPAPAPAPVISFSNKIDVAGNMLVGSTLKLKNYKALVSGATITPKLQWFAGTKKIKKATKAKLTLTKAMKGKKISVKVTATVGTTAKTLKVKAGKVI